MTTRTKAPPCSRCCQVDRMKALPDTATVKGVDKVYHCGGEKLSHWCDDKGVQGE